jgi:hypothetical protein
MLFHICEIIFGIRIYSLEPGKERKHQPDQGSPTLSCSFRLWWLPTNQHCYDYDKTSLEVRRNVFNARRVSDCLWPNWHTTCYIPSHNYTVLVTIPLNSWCHIPEHRCIGSHTSCRSSDCRLIVWLFIVLRPAQEYFTYIETSPLPVKGCKILAYTRRSGPLSRDGSLSCTPAVIRSGFPVLSKGSPHTRGCGESILTRILPCPHSVTSYDTQVDVEDLS